MGSTFSKLFNTSRYKCQEKKAKILIYHLIFIFYVKRKCP